MSEFNQPQPGPPGLPSSLFNLPHLSSTGINTETGRPYFLGIPNNTNVIPVGSNSPFHRRTYRGVRNELRELYIRSLTTSAPQPPTTGSAPTPSPFTADPIDNIYAEGRQNALEQEQRENANLGPKEVARNFELILVEKERRRRVHNAIIRGGGVSPHEAELGEGEFSGPTGATGPTGTSAPAPTETSAQLYKRLREKTNVNHPPAVQSQGVKNWMKANNPAGPAAVGQQPQANNMMMANADNMPPQPTR